MANENANPPPPKKIRFLRGSYEDNQSYTGHAGEITIDTDHHRLVLHDGEVEGGHPQANHRIMLTLFDDLCEKYDQLSDALKQTTLEVDALKQVVEELKKS